MLKVNVIDIVILCNAKINYYYKGIPFTGIILTKNGMQEYCVNGVTHKEDGYALVCVDGTGAYYYNGKYVNCNSQKEFNLFVRKQKIIIFE